MNYGILIKKFLYRFPGIDNYQNIGRLTDTLISSNILDILASWTIPRPAPSSTIFDGVLVFGVTLEVFTIVYLLWKGIPADSHLD
jgi:hypothetical protein